VYTAIGLYFLTQIGEQTQVMIKRILYLHINMNSIQRMRQYLFLPQEQSEGKKLPLVISQGSIIYKNASVSYQRIINEYFLSQS